MIDIFLSKIGRRIQRSVIKKQNDEIRNSLLNHHGVIISPDFQFNGFTILKLYDGCKVKIGKQFICSSYPNGIGNQCGSKIFVRPEATLEIGDYTGFSNIVLHCFESITIGSYVNIGDGCMIFDSNFHSTNWEYRLDREKDVNNSKTSPVVIKDLAFIGARSIICKGVTIGEKAMVAA